MDDIESPKIIKEEIEHLELKLAEKKKELAETGTEFESEDAAKEVIKEYSSSAQTATVPYTTDDSKKAADKLASEPHARQVEELLKIAQENGIIYAVNTAKHLKNPHLLDDFHDRLVLELLKQK